MSEQISEPYPPVSRIRSSTYIYLHGFASSPRSAKAKDLRDRFEAMGIPLMTPDLNQPNFTQLTLSRQMEQAAALFPVHSPVTLIGSSFGGLTAAWLAEQYPQVERIILLAPAFQFLAQWLPRLGAEALQQWQAQHSMMVYHYSEQKMLPLSYRFVEDAAQYDETQLQRSLPTLILHGTEDDVISIQASRDYGKMRSGVRLIELDSDHSLVNVTDEIWQAICEFCSVP